MSHFADQLFRVLRECQTSKELVGLHLWEDDPSIFLVGSVLEVDGRNVLLEQVASDGVLEGGADQIALCDIVMVSRDNDYLRGLQALGHGRPVFDGNPDVRPGYAVRQLLDRALRGRRLVTVFFVSGTSSSAFVRELGDDFVELEIVESGGLSNGRNLIRLDEVRTVRLGSESEASLEYLYRDRYCLL